MLILLICNPFSNSQIDLVKHMIMVDFFPGTKKEDTFSTGVESLTFSYGIDFLSWMVVGGDQDLKTKCNSIVL